MPGKGFVVRAMTITIDDEDYACEITGLREVPSRSTQTAVTACADGSITDTGPATWTIDVTAHVDLADGSLYALLTDPDNDGVPAVIEYTPDVVNYPEKVRTADIELVTVGADFTPGSFATFQVSFPVTGAPSWVPES